MSGINRKWALAILLFSAGLFLVPVLIMVLVAFEPASDLYRIPPIVVPTGLTVANFHTALIYSGVLAELGNSLIYSLGAVALSLMIAVPAGYSLSHFRFRGRGTFMMSMLASRMIPGLVTLIPLYLMLESLHLLNTYAGVILVYAAGGIPLSIWILKGYFDTIPHEIVQAARLDGASEITIARQVMLPLAVPGVAAAAILTFIGSWLDLIIALTLLSDAAKFPFTVGLYAAYEGQTGIPDVGALFAGALVGSLPATILFLLFQRRIGGGLGGAASAIKG
ncbi:MAG: carbohydrate ABC transporter permease [Firmicutes bacterium]|nr:carbohydrate ABC transporter permease [Bacillota bacterium]